MPVYLYECRECKAQVEELQQSYREPPPEQCPACSATDSLERRMALSSFQLVGKGWARDGYS